MNESHANDTTHFPPGPYYRHHVNGSRDTRFTVYARQKGSMAEHLANVPYWDVFDETKARAEAVSFLFKAAPEMYAALQDAETLLTEYRELLKASPKSLKRQVRRIEQARQAAFVALADARGEIPF